MECKYRVRWFSSKGAFLVLLWTIFISTVICSLYFFIKSSINDHVNPSTSLKLLLLIPVLVGIASAPLSGWLADAKFGNYNVFRVGAVLLFIATVMNCLFLVLEMQTLKLNNILIWIHFCLGYSVLVVGICACGITALPLGLDQMPDASSSNNASYIAWFVCSFWVGGFIGEGLELLTRRNGTDKEIYTLIWALLLVLCMTIVLASNFLLSPKWLIIEPKSPQSLKTIYCVLKFAAKHKAPLNRSALTYWEEDIPSRIDLSKSKYGGPFTTEQVEDVKTILRLLIITLPFSVILFSFTANFWAKVDERLLGLNTDAANLFLNSIYWYGLLGSVVHEFLIYPLITSKFPSILKRIGAVTLLTTFITSVCFAFILAQYLSHSSATAMRWIVEILHRSTGGALFQIIMTLVVQFMFAQSPYNMRGLILSSVGVLVIASNSIEVIFSSYFTIKTCTQPWCPLVPYSAQLPLQIIGFILFCVVARWYKLRVRDDDYSPQRVVEEVYDRYLTAAAAQP